MNKSAFQLWVEDLVATLLSVLKIILMSKWNIKTPKTGQGKDCVILGNGPSLKDSINTLGSKLDSYDLFCVNHFGETDLYKQLKPQNYILNAPEMWMDDVEEQHYIKGEKLFTAIAQNTDWNINLFIPASAKRSSRWQKVTQTNPKITINYFNTTPVDGFTWFRHSCWRNNLGLPRPHNVLIPTLILALNIGYKSIYVLGADHSWLKDIWVSNHNEVLLTQKHFYDAQSAQAKPMDKLGKGQRKLHEVLEKFTHAFRGYFYIKDFAQSRKQNILNATPESYIDAFERVKLESIE